MALPCGGARMDALALLYFGFGFSQLALHHTVSRSLLASLRLQFTTENPGEVDTILNEYQSGGEFGAGAYTRGLYLRGVE